MRINANNHGIAVRLAVFAVCFFGVVGIEKLRQSSGNSPQLVSIEELPDIGDACERTPVASSASQKSLFAAFEPPAAYAQDKPATIEFNRPPVRSILDTAPVYSSVGVDVQHNEVMLQDSNTWSIRVFSRLDNARPNDPPNEARRVIIGPKTDVQFNSCVYVDPGSGDIYSVENDVGDVIVVFPHEATGDVEPTRKLKVTHRAFAMAVDDETQELFVSVQYPPQVAVYSKTASGDDPPKRLLIGDRTRLSDAHGIAVDPRNKLLFVNNWGNISDYRTPGTGRFEPPSISVYSITANGDTPPLRVIQGPRTQLDWPGAMSVDPETGDLYVANDMGQSLIAFHGTDAGDVAPVQVIKGPKTHLSYPTGVFVDWKNKELWASNLGNASATVYPLAANGDVPPLRIIRSAAQDKVSLRFGKTQALVYDPIREQVLVPN